MLSTAIIIFREIIEIAMILGVVLAATRGLPGRMGWIATGFAGGLMGAGLVAVFARTISSALSGFGQEFFNAGILFIAAIVIGWTVVWMRGHAHQMAMHLKRIGHDATAGKIPHYSLSLIIGLALMREGSEIVLFLYGMALSGQSASSIVAGSIIGLLLGTTVGMMLYFGLLKMPARYMLTVTSWLLILLVAGLSAQGAEYLSAAGYFSGFSQQLWDTSRLLSEESILGKSLHSLIGYSARPTAIQGIFYVGTLVLLLSIIAILDKNKKNKTAAAIATVFILTCMGKPQPALALDEIYSPHAETGEMSLEYNGSRTFDSHSDKNNDQGHELVLEYGVNDWFTGEVSGGFEKAPDNDLKMTDVEIEGRFQFTQPGEYWLDAGFLTAYDFSTQSHQPDSTEIKLLLQKDTGWLTHTANIGFDQNIGKNSGSTGGPDYVLLWNSRYRYSEYFQPGIELQSDFGQGHELGRFNDQQQYIGPSIYGKLFGNLNYQAAWLAGVSSAAAQSAARLLVEYEMHF